MTGVAVGGLLGVSTGSLRIERTAMWALGFRRCRDAVAVEVQWPGWHRDRQLVGRRWSADGIAWHRLEGRRRCTGGLPLWWRMCLLGLLPWRVRFRRLLSDPCLQYR